DCSRGTSGGAARARMRSALVVAQLALSLVLLVGAGLMIRTFLNLQHIDVGFRADQALTMRFTIPRKIGAERIPQTADALLTRVTAVPGVRHAAVGTHAPLTGGSNATIVLREGVEASAANASRRYRHGVTPVFFA